MSSSINSNLPPDFSALQSALDANSTTENSSDKSKQGQGTSVPTTGNGASAYTSFQGTQNQTTNQNINTTLAQTLGATQGSVVNSGPNQGTSDIQDGSSQDTTQVVTAGLSSDQQVTAKQGFKGQGSGTGAGGHQKTQTTYGGTAASGLQKGKGTTSSASAGSTSSVSTFTLKVDTTSTSSTSSSQSSTSYVDSNNAPALPPGPKVFAMIAESTELSLNLQGVSVSDMVAANKGMNATLASDYAKQITDIQNWVKAKNSSNSKSATAKAFSWVVNIAMIAVGVATGDPMLVAAGVAGCIMTADPKLVSGLANDLEKAFPGMSPQLANIMATLIIVCAACCVGGAASAALDVASEATTVAARAAIEAAESEGTDAAVDVSSSMIKNAAEDEVKADVLSEASAEASAEAAAEDSTEATAQASAKAAAEGSTDATTKAAAVATVEGSTEAATESSAETAEQTSTASEALAESNESALFSEGRSWFSQSDWEAWSSDVARFKSAMATPEGRAAFQTSIEEQAAAGASSVWKNITTMSVSSMIDTALDSIASGAKSVSDAAASAGDALYDAGASAARVMSNPLEAMDTQLAALSKLMAKFAGRDADEAEVAADSAASTKEASLSEKAMQSVQSLASNLTSLEPQRMIQIAADLTMAGLTTTGTVMQYNATKLKVIAQRDEAEVLNAEASTTDMNAQIKFANSQINMVLNDMNQSVIAAGNVLASMSELSSETLGQQPHGSAA